MPNYDVRYTFTDLAGVSYSNKTVVNASDGDNAVSLAATNLATRLPSTRWTIVGVAPSTAFSDTQDDAGSAGSYSPSVLAIGGRDALRAVAVASSVNYFEAVPGAAGSPGRVALRAAGTDTNISAVLSPKGTGALIAQLPDNAATGGNARGANAVDWQTVRAAAAQVASAANSVICGGANNAATGARSSVVSGQFNAANGADSNVAGGSGNISNGFRSWVPGGGDASNRALSNMGAWSGGAFLTVGDAQSEEHILRRQTTDATATRLTADNAVAGTVNTINLQNFSAIAGVLVVRARANAASLSATWFINLSATRDNGAATVLIEGGGGTALTPTHSRGTGSAWRIDVTADTTNGGIAVTVTGAAATTINWVARFMAVQTATAS